MGTGALSLYAKKLRRYIGEDMPIHYLGYTATEAFMAVPIELNSFEYVMLPQNGFYEFRPVEQEGYDNLLTIKDLEPGKEYTRDDGKTVTPYNAKKVFDISQTNARPRQQKTRTPDVRLVIKGMLKTSPVKYEIKNDLPEGVNAIYSLKQN
jgi:hypothetical protein